MIEIRNKSVVNTFPHIEIFLRASGQLELECSKCHAKQPLAELPRRGDEFRDICVEFNKHKCKDKYE